MPHQILLAGATGVIGRRLLPLLVKAGHTVTALSRTPPDPAPWSRRVRFLSVDVFDREALIRTVISARPEIVIHQLTDLSLLVSGGSAVEAGRRNARLREVGTGNLVAASQAAGAARVIAQSIAWAYAPGASAHREEDPLDATAEQPRATTVKGVQALEHAVLHSPPLRGTVLRYGQLYGPDTGREVPSGSAPVHVDAAAHAALLAVSSGASGLFNIAEGLTVSSDKARSQLGWAPEFRLDPDWHRG